MADLMERLARGGRGMDAGWTAADTMRTAPGLTAARRRRSVRRVGAALATLAVLFAGGEVARHRAHDRAERALAGHPPAQPELARHAGDTAEPALARRTDPGMGES